MCGRYLYTYLQFLKLNVIILTILFNKKLSSLSLQNKDNWP